LTRAVEWTRAASGAHRNGATNRRNNTLEFACLYALPHKIRHSESRPLTPTCPQKIKKYVQRELTSDGRRQHWRLQRFDVPPAAPDGDLIAKNLRCFLFTILSILNAHVLTYSTDNLLEGQLFIKNNPIILNSQLKVKRYCSIVTITSSKKLEQ
jgi:hypothetical protein